MGQPLGGEPMATVIDRQRAIEVGVDVDAGPGVAAAARAGLELQQAAVELDRVIVPDGPLVLEAADAFELGRCGSGPPRGLGMRGGVHEARIIAREKPVHDTLGIREGAGLGEAEFGDEAVLESAEEPLDPAFSLG